MSKTLLNEKDVLSKVDMCVKYLIKTICLDTNATNAEYVIQGLTENGKPKGDWKMTLSKETKV